MPLPSRAMSGVVTPKVAADATARTTPATIGERAPRSMPDQCATWCPQSATLPSRNMTMEARAPWLYDGAHESNAAQPKREPMAHEAAGLSSRFRRWARERLPYRGLEARVKTAGRDPVREYTVGMRAERLDGRFILCNRLGWGALVGAIVLKNVADSPSTVGPLDGASALFVLALLTLGIAAFVRSKTRTYAWIDFAVDGTPLTRAAVERTRRAVAHVRSNPDAPWVPSEVVLVSGDGGFEPDARVLAESGNIVCYRAVGSDFERVLTTTTKK
jgi:hypothetical protein